jgi:hypothetical protein
VLWTAGHRASIVFDPVMSVKAPPIAAQQLLQVWRRRNQPAQPAFAWPRECWIGTFPELAAHLRALPDLLDRRVLRQACVEATGSAEAAKRAFVTVMAWGYGMAVGYGPWRTRRILDSTPDANGRLARVAETMASAGAGGFGSGPSDTRSFATVWPRQEP